MGDSRKRFVARPAWMKPTLESHAARVTDPSGSRGRLATTPLEKSNSGMADEMKVTGAVVGEESASEAREPSRGILTAREFDQPVQRGLFLQAASKKSSSTTEKCTTRFKDTVGTTRLSPQRTSGKDVLAERPVCVVHEAHEASLRPKKGVHDGGDEGFGAAVSSPSVAGPSSVNSLAAAANNVCFLSSDSSFPPLVPLEEKTSCKGDDRFQNPTTTGVAIGIRENSMSFASVLESSHCRKSPPRSEKGTTIRTASTQRLPKVRRDGRACDASTSCSCCSSAIPRFPGSSDDTASSTTATVRVSAGNVTAGRSTSSLASHGQISPLASCSAPYLPLGLPPELAEILSQKRFDIDANATTTNLSDPKAVFGSLEVPALPPGLLFYASDSPFSWAMPREIFEKMMKAAAVVFASSAYSCASPNAAGVENRSGCCPMAVIGALPDASLVFPPTKRPAALQNRSPLDVRNVVLPQKSPLEDGSVFDDRGGAVSGIGAWKSVEQGVQSTLQSQRRRSTFGNGRGRKQSFPNSGCANTLSWRITCGPLANMLDLSWPPKVIPVPPNKDYTRDAMLCIASSEELRRRKESSIEEVYPSKDTLVTIRKLGIAKLVGSSLQ